MEELIKGAEPDAPLPDSWHLGEVFERLESWEEMDRDRLIGIEFQLSRAFTLNESDGIYALYEAVTSRPEIFTELVCLVYQPETNNDNDEKPDEARYVAAENAWRVLHHCRRQPGEQSDGSVDAEICIRFIDDARKLCAERDRSRPADEILGQILAHAPVGNDGIWPGSPARDILNRLKLNGMRAGFQTGAINKRGMTSRAPDEGGEQERTLAQGYWNSAAALAVTHPYLAAALEQLAQHYEADAKREDDDAGLRRERY